MDPQQQLLDKIVASHRNSRPLNDDYTFDESEITFENNYLDGTSLLTSLNAAEHIINCPFIIERDYAIPIIFSLFNINRDQLPTVFNTVLSKLGIERGTSFFYNGNYDFLFFFHNITVLKKAGYSWKLDKARQLSDTFENIYQLAEALANMYEGGLDSDLGYNAANDVFSYIFSFCTSSSNQQGGCNFGNSSRNFYFSGIRGFNDDMSMKVGQTINISSAVFLFYGMTMFSEENRFKYNFYTGDIAMMLQEDGILGNKGGQIINKIKEFIEQRLDPKNFTGAVVKHGIVPLDIPSSKFYVLNSIRHYKNIDAFTFQKNRQSINAIADSKDKSELLKYSDFDLLLSIRRPFVYKEKQDIVEKVLSIRKENVVLRYKLNENKPDDVLFGDRNGKYPISAIEFALVKEGKRMAVPLDKASTIDAESLTKLKDFVNTKMQEPGRANIKNYLRM